jgi:hypothetical protein
MPINIHKFNMTESKKKNILLSFFILMEAFSPKQVGVGGHCIKYKINKVATKAIMEAWTCVLYLSKIMFRT